MAGPYEFYSNLFWEKQKDKKYIDFIHKKIFKLPLEPFVKHKKRSSR